MRMLLIVTALFAFAAHAEPKRSAKEPTKPAANKEAVEVQHLEPKVIEPKEIALAAPELELKVKDTSESDLERKLAKRQAKAQSSEQNVMREPVQLKLDDPAAQAAPAPTSATVANKP